MSIRTFYAYVNLNNPIVAWELSFGRLNAYRYAYDDFFNVSFWCYANFFNMANSPNEFLNTFAMELLLENVRQTQFPHQCSRLTGIYFFETMEDVKQALYFQPKKFKRSDWVVKVIFAAEDAITKVDSNYLTYLSDTNDYFNQTHWMEKYWSGQPYDSIEPLWEIITTGVGMSLFDTDHNLAIRAEAQKLTLQRFPKSEFILKMCFIAHQYGHLPEIGMVRPRLYLDEDMNICGDLLLNVKDWTENPDVIKRAFDYYDKNIDKAPELPKDGTFGSVPDFTHLNFKLPLNSVTGAMIGTLFNNIFKVRARENLNLATKK